MLWHQPAGGNDPNGAAADGRRDVDRVISIRGAPQPSLADQHLRIRVALSDLDLMRVPSYIIRALDDADTVIADGVIVRRDGRTVIVEAAVEPAWLR